MIYPDEIRRLVPAMDLSDRPRFPILAALYHPPGGIIRHDAVVWGYARACDRLGIEIHPYTEVTGIRVARGKARERDHQARRNRRRRGAERHRGLGFDDCEDGRCDAAHRHPSAAGLRDRAAEAVSGQGDRLGHPARLREPDRQGRTGDRRGDRSVPVLQHEGHAAHAGTDGVVHAGAVSAACRPARAAAMGRHLRHDAGLRADHRGVARSGEFLRGRRLGNVRIQGRAGRGEVPGGADRNRKDAEADRSHSRRRAFTAGNWWAKKPRRPCRHRRITMRGSSESAGERQGHRILLLLVRGDERSAESQAGSRHAPGRNGARRRGIRGIRRRRSGSGPARSGHREHSGFPTRSRSCRGARTSPGCPAICT